MGFSLLVGSPSNGILDLGMWLWVRANGTFWGGCSSGDWMLPPAFFWFGFVVKPTCSARGSARFGLAAAAHVCWLCLQAARKSKRFHRVQGSMFGSVAMSGRW